MVYMVWIGCSSKSVWVIKLSFCQNDPFMGKSFWQNNSLITHLLFVLQPIIIFSPVANFGNQSIVVYYAQYTNYTIYSANQFFLCVFLFKKLKGFFFVACNTVIIWQKRHFTFNIKRQKMACIKCSVRKVQKLLNFSDIYVPNC